MPFNVGQNTKIRKGVSEQNQLCLDQRDDFAQKVLRGKPTFTGQNGHFAQKEVRGLESQQKLCFQDLKKKDRNSKHNCCYYHS